MKPILKTAMLSLSLATIVAGATGASATTTWQNDHPRRAEVNARLTHENHRIGESRREGEINQRQAYRLRMDDHRIREQERADASRHDGHITRHEQAGLNHEENRVSRQIGA